MTSRSSNTHNSQSERLVGPPALQTHQIPRKPVASSRDLSVQAAASHDNTPQLSTDPQKKGHGNVSQKHSHITWHSLDTWWGFEIASLVLSFASFVALILLLQQWDKRPPQQWSYSHLTLNGLVAILSTVTRAALLVPVAAAISQAKWTWFSAPKQRATGRALEALEVIDQSSRGAWDSLRLLWHTRFCHLTSIGALITVLALAFDTFSQQVITVDFRNLEDSVYQHRLRPHRSDLCDRMRPLVLYPSLRHLHDPRHANPEPERHLDHSPIPEHNAARKLGHSTFREHPSRFPHHARRYELLAKLPATNIREKLIRLQPKHQSDAEQPGLGSKHPHSQ